MGQIAQLISERDGWVQALRVAAIVVGSLAGIIVGWRVVWRRGIKPFFRTAVDFTRAVIRIGHTMSLVLDEFQPNGGDSMRDQVNAVRADVERLAEKQREFTVTQDALAITVKQHVREDRKAFEEIRSDSAERSREAKLVTIQLRNIQQAVVPAVEKVDRIADAVVGTSETSASDATEPEPRKKAQAP